MWQFAMIKSWYYPKNPTLPFIYAEGTVTSFKQQLPRSLLLFESQHHKLRYLIDGIVRAALKTQYRFEKLMWCDCKGSFTHSRQEGTCFITPRDLLEIYLRPDDCNLNLSYLICNSSGRFYNSKLSVHCIDVP